LAQAGIAVAERIEDIPEMIRAKMSGPGAGSPAGGASGVGAS